jgi:hypothetical protein
MMIIQRMEKGKMLWRGWDETTKSAVWSTEPVVGIGYEVDDNSPETIAWFAANFGANLGTAFSWGATNMYCTREGREKLTRMIAEYKPAPAIVLAPLSTPKPAPVMVKCTCGHFTPEGTVMSSSMGSSCPECYDRMSE